MARKKRGGKTPANIRKTKLTNKLIENVNQEENMSRSPSESEESSNSGTPKSCNTPIEIDKPITQTLNIVQHKKFGKFRCLLEENKHEIITNETETQVDVMEVETKQTEVFSIQTENITEGLKTVEISGISPTQDITLCTEEVPENLPGQMLETVIDDNSVIESNAVYNIETEETLDTNGNLGDADENSNEGKSSDNSLKSNENSNISNTDEKLSADNTNLNDNTSTVRRSSRIRSISVLKQRSKGRGLVRNEKFDKKDKVKVVKVSTDVDTSLELSTIPEKLDQETITLPLDSPTFATPTLGLDNDQKPVKVKSRWRRSSELEMGGVSPLVVQPLISPQTIVEVPEPQVEINNTIVNKNDEKEEEIEVYDEEMEKRLRHYITLTENQYLTERTSCKEAKKMVCDCFLVEEEIERGEYGCGEDCLNRLLMIECGNQCIVGDRCTNKRFQKLQYSPCEVFRTKKKGFGIKAIVSIPAGEFILEYVGEVLDQDEFDKRAKEYSKDKNRHYYFMALRSDAVIDATQKGNISRFINHSCEPNAETQKWTVNGELRIGFFSTRNIAAGEEITFDYQFQRYGKEAQKCFCEAPTCRGWIGEEPGDDDDDDDDDEEDEDEDDDDEVDETEKKEYETDIKSDSDVVVEKKPPKAKIKTEQRKRRHIKKQRKDILEDLDLDEEIEMLSTTGVKNQTHTLKLSRLMVRAKEMAPRLQLLKLLQHGEEPCRRLFLDYHGLRLIHGWMTDITSLNDPDNLMFRLEILKALNLLPIKNKTILQDSKVLSIIEKWSNSTKTEVTSPTDSDANSPNVDMVQNVIKSDIKIENEDIKNIPEIMSEIKTEEIILENKIDSNNTVEAMDLDEPEENIKIESGLERSMDLENHEVAEEVIIETVDKIEEEEKINEKDILTLAADLVSRWSLLKEDFRIPKKERIKQMKEHEREADRGYKGLDSVEEIKKTGSLYSWKSDRYRRLEKERIKKREPSDHDRERLISRKSNRVEERNIISVPALTKHERRQLFELQVQQEEESRRRKQQEMWRQHEQRCLLIGQDPRMLSFEASANLHLYWNSQNIPNNNWQTPNFPPTLPPNLPPNMPPNLPPNLPNMPTNLPSSTIPPNIPPNMPPPHNIPPPNIQSSIPPNLTTNLTPNVPSNHQQMYDMNCMTRPPMCQNPQRMSMIMPQIQNVRSPCLKANLNVSLPQQFPSTAQPQIVKDEQTFLTTFPPPVKLPPKWKCSKDQYGRPYYYHIKIRISQWEPPEFPPAPVEETLPELTETSSSSDTSSISSDSSSDSEEDSELGDTKLLLEIRNKLKNIESNQTSNQEHVPLLITSNDENNVPDSSMVATEHKEQTQKRKRVGLVQEIIISPRTEEDRLSFKADMKRYKETKEKLRKQKLLLLEQSKKKPKVKPTHNVKVVKKHKTKHKNGTIDMNSEEAKKIKETFRNSIATVIVQHLNAYRKPDSKVGRITNTEDFKHLARKLTHFVLLKELKHCKSVEELTCNESVKVKAKDFIRKYMAKFGEVYVRPKDEMEY